MKKFKSDKLREECGVFGISNHDDASAMVALGLHALQHRGQEGCGIVSFDGNNYHSEKRQGLVGDHFTNLKILEKIYNLMMDTGNIISFLKKFSFGRLIGSGILLRVVIAIVDGIFALEINELPNFNFFIFGLALAYTILWMFNKSYIEEE